MELIKRNLLKIPFGELEMLNANEQNRTGIGLSESHVKKLMESMDQIGFLETHPIIINSKYVISDGHHRFEAAKRLKIGVVCQFSEVAFFDLATSSSIVKKWTVDDWISKYAFDGKLDYILLDDFSKKYKVSYIISAELLSGNAIATSGNMINKLKEGIFEVTNKEQAELFASKFDDFKDFPFCKQRFFLNALVKAFKIPGYNHKKMLEKISFQNGRLKQQATVKQYLENLEEIYNWKQSEKLRFI